MKRILFLLPLMVLLAFSTTFGQNKKDKKIVEDTFHVSGVCGDCKNRIENAAYIPGVKRAEWNKQTQILTVHYSKGKTNSSAIKKSIANVGHDAGEFKASDSAYQKLPHCCAYHEKEVH